jgi:hypothetical protein
MWIIMAQQCISPEVIVKGFKKCCISSAVDGTDEDMLQSGSKRSECEEDSTDCKDGDKRHRPVKVNII